MKKDKKEKKLKKKVKFSFKRMLAYVAVYLLCTFSVAGIVILSGSNSYSGNSPMLEIEDPEQSALGKMVNNLMGLTDLTANISAGITKDGKTTNLQIGGDVVLYEGFSGAELDLTAKVTNADSVLEGRIVYKNGEVFISSGSTKLSFKTDSALEGVGVVLTLLGVDANFGDLMGSFDMSLVNTLGEKITEEKLDNGSKLLFALTDDINIDIFTDGNYNLQSVEVADLIYEDITVNASINLPATNTGISVSAPADHKDVTPAFTLLKGAINLGLSDCINLYTTYEGASFVASLSLKNQNAMLSASAFGLDANLYYDNGKVYVDAPSLKLSANCDDVLSLINDYLPDVQTKEALTYALGALTSLQDNQFIKDLNFESITTNNDVISLDLKGVKLDFTLKEDYITDINCQYKGSEYSIRLSYQDSKIVVPEYDYINVFDLSDLVEPVKAYLNGSGVSGRLAFNYADYSAVAYITVNYNPFKVELSTAVLGADVNVKYYDNMLYLTLNESKFQISLNSLTEVVDYVTQKLQLTNQENITLEDAKQLVGLLASLENYLQLVKTDNLYAFTFGDLITNIAISDGLLDFEVAYEGVKGTFDTYSVNPAQVEIITSEYQLIEITQADLQEIENNLKRTAYEGVLTLNKESEQIDISYKLDFTKDVIINLSATLYNYNIAVVVQNENVYISVDSNLKISGNIKELPKLIEELVAELKGEQNTSTLASQSLAVNTSTDISFNLAELLANINLSKLNITSTNLTCSFDEIFGFENISFAISYANKALTGFSGTYNGMGVVASVSPLTNNLEYVDSAKEQEYVKVDNIADFAVYAKNTLFSNNITFNGSLSYKGEQVSYTVMLNKTDDIKVYATLTYNNRNFNVIYANEVVYVNAYNLKVKFNIADFDKYKDGIFALLGMSMPNVDLTEITNELKTFDYTTLLKYISLFNVTPTQFNLALTNGLEVCVTALNNKLNNLSLGYEGVSLQTTLSYDQINAPEYLKSDYANLLDSIDWLNATKELLNEEIEGEIVVNALGENFTINYIANIPQKTAYFSGTLLKKQVSVLLKNNCLFVAVDDYKLSFELNELDEFVAWLNSNFALDINTEMPKMDINTQQVLAVVEGLLNNLFLQDNSISASYKGYALSISGSGVLSKIVASGTEFDASISVTPAQNTLPVVNVGEYSDWTLTGDIVTSIYDLVKADIFNLQAELELDGKTYTAYIQLDVKNMVAKISTTLQGYNINLVYQNRSIYVDVDGLKLYDSVDNLTQTINELMDLFKVQTPNEVSHVKLPQKLNINDILTSLNINYFGGGLGYVNLDIKDVLNLQEQLGISEDSLVTLTLWHNEGEVNKVDVNTPFVNVKISLLQNKEVTKLNDEQISEYTTCISDLNNYTEQLYNTYEDVKTENGYALSGNIAVRYSKLKLEGQLKLNISNNNVYAHLYSDAFGLNTNIYLVNKEVFVDVAGLKIRAQITATDVNDIIAWVNRLFDQNIEFTFEDNMLNVTTPQLSGVVFDLQTNNFGIGLKEYILGGSLNTTFKDLMLNLNFENDILNTLDIATNVTDKNTVVYEGGYSEDAYEFESQASKAKNLIMRISNLSLGASVDTSVWGLDEFNNLTTLNGASVDTFNYYDEVLNLIEYAYNFYQSGNYDFTANIDLNEKVEDAVRPVMSLKNGRIYSTLQMENNKVTEGKLFAGGNLTEYDYTTATSPQSVTHSAKLYFDNNNLYASYTHNKKVYDASSTSEVLAEQVKTNDKSLNIKIAKNSLSEIASILLHVLNIDLGSVGADLGIPKCNLDVSNLQNMLGIQENNSGEIITQVDSLLQNLTSIIGMINSINFAVENNVSTFTINLNVNDEMLSLSIVFVDGTLDNITANNINVGNNQTLNIEILNNGVADNQLETDFAKLYDTTAEHIDLSNVSNLLKALINTSALSDYHITGEIGLSVSSISAASLGVDIRVKLVDGQPVVAIKLTNMPVVIGVTDYNSNATGALIGGLQRNRTINIFIKGGDAYIHTNDEAWGLYNSYDRITKIPPSAIFENIEYYLQYLLGFTNSIQSSINTAIQNGKNRPYAINICNIINSFVQNGNQFDVAINLSELAYSKDIGTLSVSLTTLNDATTNNLDYLHKMAVNLDFMGMLYLSNTLDGTPLVLTDIGSEVNMDDVYAFLADVYYLQTYQEYSRENSDIYKPAKSNSPGVDFVIDSATTVNSTGYAGDGLVYPDNSYLYNYTTNNTQITYSFVSGWYKDENYKNVFTETVYPRFAKSTAYAKWQSYTLVNEYTSATIVYNGVSMLPSMQSYYTTNPQTQVMTYYNFIGWGLTESGTDVVEQTLLQPNGKTLYAKWEIVEKLPYTFTLYDNSNNLLYTEVVGGGQSILLTGYGTMGIKYYTDVNCTTAYTGNFKMPEGNFNLYVRKVTINFELDTGDGNKPEKIEFYYNGTLTTTYSYTYYEGQTVKLNEFTGKWEYRYLLRDRYHDFLGWSSSEGESYITSYTVGANNSTIYAIWSERKNK